MLDHLPSFEISTKHKGAICQLHSFAKVPIDALIDRYSLSKSTIRKVLSYEARDNQLSVRLGSTYAGY